MATSTIPLILKLRKESHRNIARAQDLVVEALYQVFDNAVIHGGTAIWRCYKGNRFSEDIDVYIPRDIERINSLFKNLEKKGFIVEKKKIGENSLYSSIRLNTTLVRFEAIFKKFNGSLKEYETSESNLITIYTLTPEEFLEEKINTYMKRLKVRDFYDIFFLLRYSKINDNLKNKLKAFIDNYKSPIDEKDLKVLILEGIVPKTEKMLEYIKNYIK